MAKAPGLYRPDGRPARQFGEEIIEPGEPFSGETLSTIRAIVADPETKDAARDLADNTTLAPPQTPTPDHPARPHPDPLPDPLPDEQLNNITVNLTDLDAYAEDHLQTMQAMQEAAALSLPPPVQSHADATERDSHQPSVRGTWRRLVIVERGPGRALRSTLMRPRFWAAAFLIGLVAWRPWAIPFMVLTVATAVILFVLIAGADRVADIAGWGYARLKKQNPARAERLLQGGNRFLKRVQWMADRLPSAWVEGFDIPDLDAAVAPATDDILLKTRFERIAAEESFGGPLAKGS